MLSVARYQHPETGRVRQFSLAYGVETKHRGSLRETGRCLGAWSAAPLRLGLVPVLEIAVVSQGLGVPRLQ